MSAPLNREEMIRRLEELVDRALASEEPPRGVDAEILDLAAGTSAQGGDPDLHTLWSAMTALTQETRLQGRAFKDLSSEIAAQPERIGAELRAVYAARERDVQREAERRCRKDALAILIDLRDRLARGVATARAAGQEISQPSNRGWWSRLTATREHPRAGETLAAVTRGCELTLETLDHVLDSWNAREIECQGRSFDPRRMNAVEREESTEVPEGTVLEVFRSGYEWNGEVFRPAQVKVSCVPVAEKKEP